MSQMSNRRADDQFDSGRSDFLVAGAVDERHGEVEARAGGDERVVIPDVEADVAVGKSIGGVDGVEGADLGSFLEFGEGFHFVELRDGGEREDESEPVVSGGGMKGDEPSAGEAGEGHFARVGELFSNGEFDGCGALVEEAGEGIGSAGKVVRPDVEGFCSREVVLMAGKSHRKDADHLSAQELNGLIERVEAERIGAGKGKVKEGGQRAVVESGAGVIEGDVGACIESDAGWFIGHREVSACAGGAAFVCLLYAAVGFLEKMTKKLRSRGCSWKGVPVGRRRAI